MSDLFEEVRHYLSYACEQTGVLGHKGQVITRNGYWFHTKDDMLKALEQQKPLLHEVAVDYVAAAEDYYSVDPVHERGKKHHPRVLDPAEIRGNRERAIVALYEAVGAQRRRDNPAVRLGGSADVKP